MTLKTTFRLLSKTYARLLVQGPDAKRFLHGMVTNDVLALSKGQGCRAVMLTAKGKMLGDLNIYQIGEDSLLLSMDGQVYPAILSALERHLIMDDATVTNVSEQFGQVGIYGDGSRQALALLLDLPPSELPTHFYEYVEVHLQGGVEHKLSIARTNDLGMEEYTLFATPSVLQELLRLFPTYEISELSESEAELLRIESGIPKYGVDMNEERLPLEANLQHAISFTKGCYLGQEVIVRVTSRGHINRKLVGLLFPHLQNPPSPGSNLIHQTRDNAGTVMSGILSPRFGTIALGYVHRTLWEPGTRLYLGERGQVPSEQSPVAIVQKLPFSKA